ncbi:MAG TPA: hypothetical protein VE988_09715 [Gemmataceae bacterium]|nr:hypothetical protein [Gemmataceae bacterium]
MKSFSKWFCALAVIALLAGTSAAADAIAAGKVKSVNADKKTFVVTDSVNKDHTIHIGDPLVVNRDGKESKTDLNVGDVVNVCHDNGFVTWTAHYILVQGGTNKDFALVHATVKSYDAAKKQLVITDASGKDLTFPMGDAAVRLNMQNSKIEDVKIGDQTLAIVETVRDVATLKSLMIERK